MGKIKKSDIESLTSSGKPLAFIWDQTLPGFGVRCTAKGIKSYVIRYRHNKKQRIKTLGRVEIVEISDARDRAKKLLSEAYSGADPFLSDHSDVKTIEDLSKEFQCQRRDELKSKTLKSYEGLWKHIIKSIGSEDVLALDNLSLQKLRKALSGKPTTFNRCLSLTANALKWHGVAMEGHPFKTAKQFKEKPRQRILTADENKSFYKSLMEYKEQRKSGWRYADLFILLLLTGLRRDEWRCGRWEWIDWENGIYALPDNKTGGRDVLLSSLALEHLKSMHPKNGKNQTKNFPDKISGFIFPAPRNNKKPLSWTWRIWNDMRKACKLEGFRIHDMRHTAGSFAHKAGLSQRQVADFLGHNRLETSSRYIHDMEKKESAEIASQAVSEGWWN